MTNIIYFSVCRYVPSILRGEYVNIGLAYHIPSEKRLNFIASKNIRRIKSFDDEIEVDVINAIFESLKYEFGSITLEKYDEYEDIDLSNPNLLTEKTSGYVNQIQFSEVKVYESQDDTEKAIKDLTDMFLYYDKKKSERINQDRVRALAVKIINSSSYKSSLERVERKEGFFEHPYDIKFNINGHEKYIKAFSFDYKHPRLIFKEIKAYLYELEHALNNGLIRLSDIKIVINNTDLESNYEKEITKNLPEELEVLTLEQFNTILNNTGITN